MKRNVGKGGKETADFQINVRFTKEDVKKLATCQKTLGGLSQADTIRQLVLMYLGKIPAFGSASPSAPPRNREARLRQGYGGQGGRK